MLQGSSLSPTLFNVYLIPLIRLIQAHGIKFMNYADDTQLIISVDPSHPDPFRIVQNCMHDISLWLRNNCLKFNASKTEVMCYSKASCSLTLSSQLLACLHIPESARAQSVRNLGIEFDEHLGLNAHVKKVSATCFATLRALRTILSSPPTEYRPRGDWHRLV